MKKDNKTVSFNDPLGNPYLVLNLPEKEIHKIHNKLKGGKKMTVDEAPGYKDKKALEELYVKKGMSAGQIAKMFKVSRTVILYWLKRNGIEITTRKQPKPGAKQDYKNPTWLRKMLDAGKSVWAIAKDQGVAYATVRNHVLKLQPMDAKVEKETTTKKKEARITAKK